MEPEDSCNARQPRFPRECDNRIMGYRLRAGLQLVPKLSQMFTFFFSSFCRPACLGELASAETTDPFY